MVKPVGNETAQDSQTVAKEFGVTLAYLLQRANEIKLPNWCECGRHRRWLPSHKATIKPLVQKSARFANASKAAQHNLARMLK